MRWGPDGVTPTVVDLIQVAELFRGTTDHVHIYPKEILRHAMACDCIQILCARTSPGGRAQATEWGVAYAKRLRYTLQLFELALVEHVIVGQAVTSLAMKGCFRPENMCMYG